MATSPNVSQIQVPIALQNLTIQYKPIDLIGEQVAPIVPVPAPQVKILKYSKANLFRLQDGDLYRNEGGLTKRFNYAIQTQYANPKQISAEVPVTDELLDVSSMPGQLPLQPLIDAVQLAVTKIDQYKEVTIANTIYGNTWADGTAGGTLPTGGNGGWTLATTSNTFITDVFNAKNTIRGQTGVLPNVLVMDYQTFIDQQTNPNMSDKIKYTQLDIKTAGLIADVLQLDEVLVGRDVVVKGAPNGLNSNVTTSSVWDPSGNGNAFLYYREPAGLRALSAIFTFRLPYMGSLRFIRGYRQEDIRSTIYQVTEQVDIAPVALDVGYAWTHTHT